MHHLAKTVSFAPIFAKRILTEQSYNAHLLNGRVPISGNRYVNYEYFLEL
jgi:hypothetical protein